MLRSIALSIAVVAAGWGALAGQGTTTPIVPPDLSNEAIHCAVKRNTKPENKVTIHRKLWGNFDGDENPDLALLVEITRPGEFAANCATELFFTEWNEHELGVVGRDRLGYWPGIHDIEEIVLQEAGPFLEKIDVDGDGVDEVLCRYDRRYVQTGASDVHARIYRWNGERHQAVWDEPVYGGDGGGRSYFPSGYDTTLTFQRARGGSLVVLLSATREKMNYAYEPVRIECLHKVFAWDGSTLALVRNELVYERCIRREDDRKLSRGDVAP